MESLTIDQAVEMLNVTRTTLIRWLDEGRIPFTGIGDERSILASHVLAYIDERDRWRRVLAEARANRRSIEEEIADELGLNPEEAERLGITT